MNPTLTDPDYRFSSAFEGGNLDCVVRVRELEFDLFLRVDSNTRGHTAWFYFSLANSQRRQTVTLHLCNLKRPSPLYAQGSRPFVFSRRGYETTGRGWEQGGENCRCESVPLRYEIAYELAEVPEYYRLSFDYEFEYEQDEVFFAYCVPYSYSQLQQDRGRLELSPFCRRGVLGRSLIPWG